jgi:membrane protein insertase Oxa1/YidC/SpoIIIJ
VNLLYLIFIAPIEALLAFLFSIYTGTTRNYGISLILMSLSVTLLTAPLYYLAERWKREEEEAKRRMAKEVASVKKHYEGQKRFYLTRNIHRLHHYSPLMSVRASFGLFVQIPFFFAAYRFLSHFGGYAGVSFGFIGNLAKPDGVLGGLNVLPFVMTAINIVSTIAYTHSFNLKKNASLLAMSLLFLIILYDSPAALLVYWTMNNVFSLIKNLFFPAKKISEADEAESETPTVFSSLRELYGGSLALPVAIASFALLVAAQNYWLIRFERSYKYCIALTGLAAAALSLRALARLFLRASTGPGRPRVIVSLFLSWTPALVSLYFLFFERRQNAYISNPNIKMLTTLLLDACAAIAVAELPMYWGGAAGTKKQSPAMGRFGLSAPYLLGIVYLCASLFFLWPLSLYFSAPGDIGMSAPALVAANAPPFLLTILVALVLGLCIARKRSASPETAVVAAIIAMLSFTVLSAKRYGVLDDFALERAFMLDQVSIGLVFLDASIVTASAILARYITSRRRSLHIPAIACLCLISIGQISAAAITSSPPPAPKNAAAETGELPPDSAAMHRFSRTERNVVFLIADMYNGNYLGRVLSDEPQYRAALDGFVWFPQTLSVSSHTATSLPAIYGGRQFWPDAMNQRQGSGMEKLRTAASDFYGALKGHGLRLGIVDPTYINPADYGAETTESEAYVQYWLARHPEYRSKVSTGGAKNALLSMLSLFRGAPFLLKARLYDDGAWIVFHKSYQFDYMTSKTIKTYGYLDSLPEVSSVADGEGTALFIHTQFTHEPYGVKEDGSIIRGDFPDPVTKSFIDRKSAYYTARRFTAFLVRWVEWMKEAGVYDNTTIIVISDHGNNTDDHGFPLPPAFDNPIDRANLSRANALLLVKRAASRGELVEDQRLMSNADSVAILFSDLGDTTRFGDDPSHGDAASRTLKYAHLTGTWRAFLEGETTDYTTYVVRDAMNKPTNWSKP